MRKDARVLLVWGGGGLFGGRGRGPGLGGVGGDGGGDWSLSSLGIMAGRRRAMDIFSVEPPGMAILNECGCLSTMRNGPTYGVAIEGCMPPLCTNAWVAVCNSSGR